MEAKLTRMLLQKSDTCLFGMDMDIHDTNLY